MLEAFKEKNKLHKIILIVKYCLVPGVQLLLKLKKGLSLR